MIALERAYLEAFEKIGLSEFLQYGQANTEDSLRENVVRVMFWPEKPDVALRDIESTKILLNREQRYGSNTLEDLMAVANYKKVLLLVLELEKRNVSSADVILLHDSIFEGTFGQHKGLRRARVRIGLHISPSENAVDAELNSFLETYNRAPKSPTETFVNNAEQILQFFRLHPFEDGNGRTIRLLSLLYTTKNEIPPLIPKKDDWHSAFDIESFDNNGYELAFIAISLLSSVRSDGKERFMAKVKDTTAQTLQQLEIKDLVLSIGGSVDENTLKVDVARLYNGRKSTLNTKLGAIWLAGYNKIESPILDDALVSGDDRVRGMALLALNEIDFQKHISRVKDAMLNDSSARNRSSAIRILSIHHKLDDDIVDEFLNGRRGEMELVSLASSLWFEQDGLSDRKGIAERMLNISGASNLGFRLSYVLARTDEKTALGLLEGFKKKRPEEIEATILGLRDSGNLFIEDVAEKLSSIAASSKQVREPLLAALAYDKWQGKGYEKLLEPMLNSEIPEERAYSTEILGRAHGLSYLASKGKVLDRMDTLNEIALFDVLKGIKADASITYTLEPGKPELFFVQLVELGRERNLSVFGNKFLSETYKKLSEFEHENEDSLLFDVVKEVKCRISKSIQVADIKMAGRDLDKTTCTEIPNAERKTKMF